MYDIQKDPFLMHVGSWSAIPLNTAIYQTHYMAPARRDSKSKDIRNDIDTHKFRAL